MNSVLSNDEIDTFADDMVDGITQPFTARNIIIAIEQAVLAKLADRLKDGERYRWLREQCQTCRGGLTICAVNEWDLTPWSGDNPDKAIDAAMSATTNNTTANAAKGE